MSFDLQHGLEVAKRCPARIWLAGLLHDALEDTELTAEDLLLADVPRWAVVAIEVVTRQPGERYEDYITRLSRCEGARVLKIADLEANLARMDEAHESLRTRYEKALARLRGVTP